MIGTFCPIFTLHRIECPDRKIRGHSLGVLQQQLEYVHNRGYKPIALSTLAKCIAKNEPLPEKAVAFSIDDGFVEHYDLAGPLFSKFGIPLHYFLITGFVNGDIWPWDDQVQFLFDSAPSHIEKVSIADTELKIDLHDSNGRRIAVGLVRDLLKRTPNNNLYSNLRLLFTQLETNHQARPPTQYEAMNWDNAKSLLDMGHEIGAHTQTHRILSQLTHDESEDEILGSIQTVRKMIGQCSPVFCYPTGRECDFTVKEEKILEGSDCFAAVTTKIESLEQHHNRYQLPRLPLPSNMTDFIQYISWVECVKKKSRHALHL